MAMKSLVTSAALAAVLSVVGGLAAGGDGSGIVIEDAYVRSGPKSGAAFFQIRNTGETPDRLLEAASDAAPRVELHTHIEDADGVMKMRPIEGGIPIPAGGMHMLQRGGDHVMLMGLPAPLEQGSTLTLTLRFEQAGAIVIEMPVDNARKPAHSGH